MVDKISGRILTRPDAGRVLDTVSKTQRRQALLAVKNGWVDDDADLMMRSNAREVETDLKRNHLPKLERAGYIEWDRDTGTISKGPNFDEIKPFLELIEAHADELPPGWP